MNLGDLIWLLIIIPLAMPALQQHYLEYRRQLLIARLERERGSRVILLVHRQETMRLLGFPLARYIDVTDSEGVLRAVQLTDPDVPIDLVLQTPGGLALAALQIARAIGCREAPVTVFVPQYAMSGGTLIALAANEIVMSPHAVLGSIDPQIGEYPAVSILYAAAQKQPGDIDDETLVKADVARKAIGQIRAAVVELAARRLGGEKAAALAEQLTDGRWTHDFPLFAEQASALGLKITTTMPQVVLDLMALYPQPARPAGGGVEYLPAPRRKTARPTRAAL